MTGEGSQGTDGLKLLPKEWLRELVTRDLRQMRHLGVGGLSSRICRAVMRKREQTEGSGSSGMLAGRFWESGFPQPHKDFPTGTRCNADASVCARVGVVCVSMYKCVWLYVAV